MKKQLFSAAATVVVGAAVTSCSSPAALPPPGELPAGTAKVTVNNRALPTTTAVQCEPIGWLTTIKTGNAAAGLTALISNESELNAKSVSITDLGGFTGRYMREIEGKSDTRMTGRTYLIRGTADGFDADKPAVRTSATFTIQVSC